MNDGATGAETRQKIVAGNWKMHTTVAEATALAGALTRDLGRIDSPQVVVCPPFISLAAVAEAVAGSSLAVGAQNLHWVEKGAYTGEISPPMLAGICQYVIVGHSERRQYFGETDETVNRKARAALDYALIPIICVGESLSQRESGETGLWLDGQITAALNDLGPGDVSGLVIAYEPIWAIGTGRAATSAQANDTIGGIRRTVADLFGSEVAAGVPILYGGSVTAANSKEFLTQPEVDGALVGGASLKAVEFAAIVRAAVS